MPNFRGNEDLCKLGKEYLNDLLCKLGPFCLQHFKTFDISHAFLQVTTAELLTLKQVWFFVGPPCSSSSSCTTSVGVHVHQASDQEIICDQRFVDIVGSVYQ